MLIISVVGKLSSGKTTIAKIFAKKLNCEVIEISSLVKKFTELTDRKSLQDEIFNHRNDVDWLYKEWLHNLNNKILAGQQVIVTSGIREPYLLCKIMEDNIVVSVGVKANDFVRYRRLVTREGYISSDEFKLANEKDEQLGTDIVITMSDFSIDSTLSLDEIEKCTEQILTNCGQTSVYYKND